MLAIWGGGGSGVTLEGVPDAGREAEAGILVVEEGLEALTEAGGGGGGGKDTTVAMLAEFGADSRLGICAVLEWGGLTTSPEEGGDVETLLETRGGGGSLPSFLVGVLMIKQSLNTAKIQRQSI